MRDRERTLEGFVKRLFHNQRASCRRRGMKEQDYTLDELFLFMMDNDYKNMHKIWVDSNYDMDLAPSIDRLYNNETYSLDNIQLITWKENNAKGNKELRSKISIDIDGKIIVANSVKEATDILQVTQATITNCLKKNGFLKKRNAALIRL